MERAVGLQLWSRVVAGVFVCGWCTRVASAGTLAILPGGVDPGRVAAIQAALAEQGYPDAELVDGASVAQAVDLVPVEGLPPAEDCSRRIRMEDWRSRFEDARGELQLLSFADALSELVALDLELVCLATTPASSDLFRLELALGEAHTFLAQAAPDADTRAFHASEAEAALRRAADFGAALSVPAGLAPEVLGPFERARAQRDEDAPRVIVVGPGARVGARFNGRPLPEGGVDGVRGTNLVQAAEGSAVTASKRIRLTTGRTLVWLSARPTLALGLDDALEELAGGQPGEQARPLLSGLARLTGEGGSTIFVTERRGGVVVWRVEGAELVSTEVAIAPPPVDRWSFAIGAGPAFGWSNLSDGVLAGLGGPNVGGAVHARIGANPWLAVALTFDPWVVGSAIPEEQGGGTLFRATIPARAGVRFGPHVRRLAVEAGVDVGVHAFGRYLDGDEPTDRLSFLANGAVGASVGVGDHVGMRGQVWFGAGLGYVAGGASIGVEGRL